MINNNPIYKHNQGLCKGLIEGCGYHGVEFSWMEVIGSGLIMGRQKAQSSLICKGVNCAEPIPYKRTFQATCNVVPYTTVHAVRRD